MTVTKPRIWTIFAIFVVIILAQGCSGILVSMPVLLGHDFGSGPLEEGVFDAYMQKPGVMLAFLVLGQLAILVPVALAAAASPTPWRTRLATHAAQTSWKRLPLYGLSTLGAGAIGGLLVDLEASAYAQDIVAAMEGASVPVLVGFILLGSVLPGIIEELVFRGYIQTRLAQRWPAWAAIGLSSVLFAAFHFDPLYVVAVLPIGLWLGFLAWRTGGTRLGMACHMVNNAVAFGLLALETRVYELPDAVETGWNLVLIGCLVAGVWVLRHDARSPDEQGERLRLAGS